MKMQQLSINGFVSLIILLIFIHYTVRGYRRGFIKQARFTINTVLAVTFAPVIMPFFWLIFNQLQVTEQLEKYIQGFLTSYYYSHTVSGVMLSKEITNGTLVGVDGVAATILAQNAGVIAGNIIRTMSYSFAFILLRIALQFIFHVSDFVAALPIIHEFDKAFGALAGGFMTILSLWVITTFMSLLTFVPGIGTVFNLIMSIPVVQAFRVINPFQLLVQAVEMVS